MTIDLPVHTADAPRTRKRLYAEDVLRLWNDEQAKKGRKPIKLKTVIANIGYSFPAAPGKPPNRYQHKPMPLPTYPDPDRPRAGQRPYWEPGPGETVLDVEERLRAWWNDRPGRGRKGIERPYKTRGPRKAPQRRACGCGSGLKVPSGQSCGRCGYGLTRREREVCYELVGGATRAEVAARLNLSPLTVRGHVKSAYRKVGVHSRAELVALLLAEPLPEDPVTAVG